MECLVNKWKNIDDLTPAATAPYGYTASNIDFVNNYSYDRLDRLTQVTQQGQQNGDAVAAKRVDFSYNADGQFSTIATYNNLDGGSTHEVAASVYGYDNDGRLTSLIHTHDSTALASYTWHYDAAGDMTQMTIASSAENSTRNYQYDNAGQLTLVTGDRYDKGDTIKGDTIKDTIKGTGAYIDVAGRFW